MATNFLTKLFGSRNDRLLKQYRKTVARINAMEPEYEKLSDEALRGKTQEFKERIAQGETLDALLPEAFAVVREGSKRVMKMRHFDVQLIGGMALHHGKIAEMRTGEGKTLTATLPVYLNALSGQGVHVVTVNDYLAGRDAQWMGRLYNFLGLSVGINLPQIPREEKQAAYNSDITYGTNNEYGFDYLRDNMVYDARERVQRGLNFAIVDEVDSILIDEARTPLIISGQAEDHTAVYLAINKVVPLLTRQEGEADPRTGEGVTKPGDFTVDEKAHQIYLTEQGHETAERVLVERGLIAPGASLYDAANIALMHHLYAALRAHYLFHRDQHYVVQTGEQGAEIVIVDEFTGRLMSGRRWSDGLHQAVEAKEGVPIQAENQTLASITFQNYFRLYGKLAGMTGTADTEAYEFQEIYGLETVVIPPNRPSKRDDQLDRVYKTTPEKYAAAIQDIRECYERGQPVLVGTTSIENSEIIDQLLNKEKLPHQVLNAKHHEREAEIVAQAGRPGMITIATNMAGRGTDIVLGGNIEKQVAAIEADEALPEAERERKAEELRAQWKLDHEKVTGLGGLRIIATERHESRRIDNQLRGRSGRQGDPGESRFYLSLTDDLMRLFQSGAAEAILSRTNFPDDVAIVGAEVLITSFTVADKDLIDGVLSNYNPFSQSFKTIRLEDPANSISVGSTDTWLGSWTSLESTGAASKLDATRTGIEKRIEIALTYIYGIGRTRAHQLLAETGVNPDLRVHELGDEELVKLRDAIEANFKIEGDLRREVQADIRRKIEIGSYQGRRHRMGLPVRGQRTKTNARTRKGPKRTVAGKKKAK